MSRHGSSMSGTVTARPLVQRIVQCAGAMPGKFVACAYGEGIVEVRHVPNDAQALGGIMVAIGELAVIPGANIYILPGLVRADLATNKRGAVEDMVARFALVSDFDRHEGAAIDWAAKMPIEPHLVCETSPGNFQCWVFLDKPYRPDEVAPIGKALVPMLDDREGVIGDMARVVRVPGTLNHPNAKKLAEGRNPEAVLAQIVQDVEEWQQGYSLTGLRTAILARDPSAFDQKPEGGNADPGDFDWSRRKKPSEPPELLDDAAIVRALSKDGDRSELAFTLIRRLQRANYAAEEMVALLLRYANLPVMGHYGEPVNEERVRVDVRRAFHKRNPSERTAREAFGDAAREYGAAEENSKECGAAPLRVVHVQGGALVQNVNDAEAALIEQGAPIYQRGELLVRPGEVVIEVRGRKKAKDLLLVAVKRPELVEHMTGAADFQRWDARKDDWKTINCPPEIGDAYLARVGRWNLRPLMGIVNAPTLRPDGTLLDQLGYDDATGLLYDPRGVTFPPLPDKPTRADALAAVAVLEELIGEFPFASPEARAVALAAFLTICIRRTLPAAPLFGIDGTGPGTGKGLLADTIAMVGSGRAASPVTAGANEEELEKRVASMLLRGDLAICIDNLSAPLESAFLCSALTQQSQAVRVLGQSKVVITPTNSLFLATANGITYAGDMWRRGLTCLIDPALERPSERVFDFSPLERAKQDRGRYVAACLTIMRAYQAARSPAQKGKPMGSFEPWCRVVRDALIWLGEADAAATCNPPTDDPERERFAAVLVAWQAIIGEGRPVTIARAIEIAAQAAVGGADTSKPELLAAFHAVAAPMVRGGDSKIDQRRLGEWVRKKKRSVGPGGLRLMPDGITGGATRWRLEKTSGRAF